MDTKEHRTCWSCCEWLINKYGEKAYSPPWRHCHHSEPQEKPKEKCWCDEPTFCYVLVGEQPIRAEFCPGCGKKREEWGK